jgi:uncharacterized repeat protein (TIGR01451 family)
MLILMVFALLAATGAAGQTTATTTNTTIVVGLTLPYGVQILTGTATSPATGAPVRHLWTGDQGGLCRVDPDLDSPGPFTVNPATCISGVSGAARFTAGRMAFDPLTDNIYTVDNGSAQNVARYHYLPNGDSGQGLVSSTGEILGDANGCGLSNNFPWSISLGPDGDLYVGFRKNGNVVRVLAPQSASVPCANMQVMGHGFDQKITKALAWIGHDLWGQDVVGLWRIANADQCFTPANNFTPCAGTALFRAQVPNGFSMATDQAYPATNGNNLYSFDATGTSIALISGLATGTDLSINTTYASGILTGLTMTIDNSDPARQILYLGADPGVDAAGVGPTGTVIKVAPVANIAPGTPVNASAAPGNGQATVSWAPGGGGAPTSYLVHNSFASNGVTVPDVTVTAPAGSTIVPTSVVVTGLSNGFSYQFQISASNAFGTSGFSTPSNLVTPFIPTVPSAPGTVAAAAGNAQATVAWSKPASDGGSPITSYSITAYVGGAPAGIGLFVAAPATSGTVTGLTNGTTYTFTVHATNAVGNSPESLPSNAVIPAIPLGPTDMAISMSGPATDNPGGNATYTITVANQGPNFAPSVIVQDPIPGGATFVSATTSQGTCAAPTIPGGVVHCLLSSMLPGASATVTVTISLTATTTNTASVQAFDSTGAPLSDPNPANNTASASTTIGPPPTNTDLQVTGAASNGGPAVGTLDTFTWQIKDNQSTAANQVTFTTTLPASLPFSSVSTNLGSCQGPGPGASGTIICTASTISGGQTMVVTVVSSVATAGTIPITGSATFNGTDTNPANNSFTVTISAH